MRLPAGTLPAAKSAESFSAMATNPTRGLEWKIFCKAAANVALPSQASGKSVTQTWRALPILMTMVVARHSATQASS